MGSASLSALLSQALIAFTIEFDAELNQARRANASAFVPSLAMWSNVLRFAGKDGVEERRLPALSGVSKPAIHSMVACLARHGWVTVEADRFDARKKIVRLTPRCAKLAIRVPMVLDGIEQRWARRFGKRAIENLRRSLESIAADSNAELPHYPMAISHRGGTPTGH